jgi:hypothetical protein
MELDPSLLKSSDWEKLEETALTIIKNSTRDFILWSFVLAEVQRQKGVYLDEEKEDKTGSVAGTGTSD